ncbi:hypothetical protein ACFL1U_00980 [Patescibacteria group bacterium]
MRQILKKYIQFWEVSLIIILLVTAGTFFVSIVLPSEYQSESTVLIVQKQSSLDLFNAAKASEYVSTILGEVVYTDQFITEVIKNDTTLSNNLPPDIEQRSRAWDNYLSLAQVEGAGILHFSFSSSDPALAQRYMQGVVNTLLTNAAQYHGRGAEVELHVIDNPTLDVQPVRPRVFMNTLVGFISSLILVGILFYLEDIYNIQLFRWSKRREEEYYAPEEQTALEAPDVVEEQQAIEDWLKSGEKKQ